jgi:hypothetical protein
MESEPERPFRSSVRAEKKLRTILLKTCVCVEKAGLCFIEVERCP